MACRLDQLGQVEPLALECGGSGATDRPEDVGRVPTRDLDGKRIVGVVVVDHLEDELDVVVLLVEGRDHGLLRGDLRLDVVARAEAAEPGYLDGLAAGRFARGRGAIGALARLLGLAARAATSSQQQRQDHEYHADAWDGASHCLSSKPQWRPHPGIQFDQPLSSSARCGLLGSRRPTPATAAAGIRSESASQWARTTSRSR